MDPCTMCGVASSSPACGVCTQGLAGVDARRLADGRVAAAAALWLAVRPGLPFVVLGDTLAAIAAERGVQPFSATGATEPVRTAFAWLDLDALRPVVTEAVRALTVARRRADADRQGLMSARMASPSDTWGTR